MMVPLPHRTMMLDVAVLDGDIEVSLEYIGRATWSVVADGRYAGIIREWGNAYQARSPGDETLGGAEREEWTVALHLLLMEADVGVAVSGRAVFR
ncbi:hypothetical protein ACFVWR_13195 [Leifsonia sp. NPDC058292]|uniref:hypothetical protein n=1 Tax=Leifsonia sp. NPDC058292 TaxID=3346428 RepID=UPI0036DF6F76